MLFHITVKNSSENFIEESEIQGITNLINNLEDIELIGAWQDNLSYNFYLVVNFNSIRLFLRKSSFDIPEVIGYASP